MKRTLSSSSYVCFAMRWYSILNWKPLMIIFIINGKRFIQVLDSSSFSLMSPWWWSSWILVSSANQMIVNVYHHLLPFYLSPFTFSSSSWALLSGWLLFSKFMIKGRQEIGTRCYVRMEPKEMNKKRRKKKVLFGINDGRDDDEDKEERKREMWGGVGWKWRWKREKIKEVNMNGKPMRGLTFFSCSLFCLFISFPRLTNLSCNMIWDCWWLIYYYLSIIIDNH